MARKYLYIWSRNGSSRLATQEAELIGDKGSRYIVEYLNDDLTPSGVLETIRVGSDDVYEIAFFPDLDSLYKLNEKMKHLNKKFGIEKSE